MAKGVHSAARLLGITLAHPQPDVPEEHKVDTSRYSGAWMCQEDWSPGIKEQEGLNGVVTKTPPVRPTTGPWTRGDGREWLTALIHQAAHPLQDLWAGEEMQDRYFAF